MGNPEFCCAVGSCGLGVVERQLTEGSVSLTDAIIGCAEHAVERMRNVGADGSSIRHVAEELTAGLAVVAFPESALSSGFTLPNDSTCFMGLRITPDSTESITIRGLRMATRFNRLGYGRTAPDPTDDQTHHHDHSQWTTVRACVDILASRLGESHSVVKAIEEHLIIKQTFSPTDRALELDLCEITSRQESLLLRAAREIGDGQGDATARDIIDYLESCLTASKNHKPSVAANTDGELWPRSIEV